MRTFAALVTVRSLANDDLTCFLVELSLRGTFAFRFAVDSVKANCDSQSQVERFFLRVIAEKSLYRVTLYIIMIVCE